MVNMMQLLGAMVHLKKNMGNHTAVRQSTLQVAV